MIDLYPDLTQVMPRKQWPPLPTGAYLMDPEHPVIKSNMKDMKPFFKDVRRGWEEYYYAIVVPDGYEITGVEMEATGKVFRKGTSGGQSGDDFRIRVHPFPLARDVHSSWIGALYGQTLKTTTLRKGVTFHGENRKIIVVEVGAAGAEIDGWGLKGHIQKIKRKTQDLSSLNSINWEKSGSPSFEYDSLSQRTIFREQSRESFLHSQEGIDHGHGPERPSRPGDAFRGIG